MARKPKTPVARPLYAWSADRKASRAIIRHHLALAIWRKAWAENVTPEWRAAASTMSLQWVDELTSRSVRRIARDTLEYHRMRAWMRGAYPGWPGDRPARDLWNALR